VEPIYSVKNDDFIFAGIVAQKQRIFFDLFIINEYEEEKVRGIIKGTLLSALIAVVVLAGCSRKIAEVEVKEALAVVNPTEGSKVNGTVSFAKDGKGVRITANVEGLSPGLHGFHIHEFGDCSSPDASSAGGHFNPTGMPHAGPKAEKRHVGDLGNLEAAKNGVAKLEVTDDVISLEGPESIVGRSVIIHARTDDLKTQPAGGAGARVACGVIGISK
jgi:Cu-Zn family superoxide dismutase